MLSQAYFWSDGAFTPPEDEAKRTYTIKGKAELGGMWSSPVEASHRFFHVKVEMK